jgi:hypothetical protein
LEIKSELNKEFTPYLEIFLLDFVSLQKSQSNRQAIFNNQACA